MINHVIEKIQAVMNAQIPEATPGWVNTLSEMDELSALKEATTQLKKIHFTHASQAKRVINTALTVDRKMASRVKEATRNYMIALSIGRDFQNRIQLVVFGYQKQLLATYQQFLDVYQHQNKVVLESEKINLILARMLNAAFLSAKWSYFDDQSAPAGTWSIVHNVIRVAEELSLVNNNLFLYEFSKTETSIASILEQGFMLDTLRHGNFTRVEVQLTERILRTWAGNPVMATKYKQDRYHFCIKLESDSAPERVRTVEKFAEYRFWRTTRLTDLIEAYLCAVDTQKPLDEFKIEGIAPINVLVKLFKKLRVEWCVSGYERQRRKEKRQKAAKLISVSYGLEDICRRMNILQAAKEGALAAVGDSNRAQQHAAQLANQLKNNALGIENWWMVDESASGFAVDLGKEISDWIIPGKLIGYTSSEDKRMFYIAEIKSVRKQASGNYRAGLEIITQQGLSIQVSRLVESQAEEVLDGYYVADASAKYKSLVHFPGLYVKTMFRDNDEGASLILPRGQYKRGTHYRIMMGDEEKIVLAGRPIQAHRDWVQVQIPA